MPYVRRQVDRSRLAKLVEQRARIDADLRAEIDRLRSEDGASWLDIGEALGISRQAARTTYGV